MQFSRKRVRMKHRKIFVKNGFRVISTPNGQTTGDQFFPKFARSSLALAGGFARPSVCRFHSGAHA
jgi:hypothetical protein